MHLRRTIPRRASQADANRRGTLLFLFLLLITIRSASSLSAQESSRPAGDNAAPYTLHLYARLVELPTIILPRPRHSTPLDPQQVNIAIDAGRSFHPVSLRLEGNDPLSIAILLDLTDNRSKLLPALSQNFSAWLTHSLKPQDKLSIYSLDCDLMQAAENQPPVPTLLQPALDRAIAPSLEHAKKSRSPCPKAVGLRDSIYFLMERQSEIPGRHVLIVLTDGVDQKGVISWPELASAATLHAVTLFALTTPSPMLYQWAGDLNNLAQHSGGFFFSTTPAHLPAAMASFVQLLRTRYILQFPMPPHLGGGIHHVDVTLTKIEATIRPSGITVPLPNPSIDHPATDLPSEAPRTTPNP